MTRRIVLVFGVFWLMGCAGSQQMVDNPELQKWAGTWHGMALRENRADPSRQWTLVLSLKNGRLLGVISDDIGELRRKKVDDLRVVDGQLHFSITYETARGLQVNCRHRADWQDDKLLSVFEGREGGRAFEGKWEAERIPGTQGTATQ